MKPPDIKAFSECGIGSIAQFADLELSKLVR